VSPDPGGDQVTLNSLRRFAQPVPATAQTPPAPAVERCELCAEILGTWHGHIVDVETRALQCTCRACYLLFTPQGAAGGRRKAVPDRVLQDPTRELTEIEWNELSIPVATAFFFHNSALDQVVAFYPSPAGATESLLDLDAWRRIKESHPLLSALEPDVEAILVTTAGEQGREVFLVPIDICYALVGEIRRTWQGFDGGAEAHAAMAGFLDGLRDRSRPLKAASR
jgi:Family of unknown function (DUF5947)